MKKNDLVINMSEESVQELVEKSFGRKLKISEYQTLRERVDYYIHNLIIDEACKIISFSKLKKRMRGVENKDFYFLVYFKNVNTFQNSFVKVGAFKNQKDAKQFIKFKEMEQFDEWKITQVIKGVEVDLAKEINEF